MGTALRDRTVSLFQQQVAELSVLVATAREDQDQVAVSRVLEKVQQLARLSERVEAAHLQRALESDEEQTFEGAQKDLESARARFAAVVLRAQEQLFSRLSGDDRRFLSRHALIELAPASGAPQLEVLRRGLAEVRSRRAGAGSRDV